MPVGQQVLFIQGGGAGAHDDWDAKLVASLRGELGDGCEVRFPPMPQEDDPNYARWSAVIEQQLAAVEDGVVLVGHSVGATILVHFLAKASRARRVGAVVLLAAPFVGAGGWPGEEFELPHDLGARLPPGVPVHIVHGLDDQAVPPNHVDLYARILPQAQLHKLPGRDHQLNDDLSDVAHLIASIPTKE